ncbi:endosomal/lysosomal proton channel TMEM175-like [Glandiceps talaboti]
MPRRHRFMSSERVQGYSDAVYAIVITILIIPLSDGVLEYDKSKTLFENISDEYQACVVYVLAFIFICSDWEEHVWLFESIENVGDTVLLANLLALLPVTFLPFTFSLLTVYIWEPFAIILFCACGFLIIVFELFITMIAFRRPEKLVKEAIPGDMTPKSLSKITIFKCCVKLLLVVVAGVTSPFSIYTSYVFLGLLMIHDWISGIIVAIFHHFKGQAGYRHRHFGKYLWHHLFTMRFSKMRYTVFADGVFSIVATLIILDLSSTGIPDDAAIREHGALRHTLLHEKHMYLSFVGSFMTVGLLWLNHHTVFHFVHSVSRIMSTFNKFSLLFVGILPYCFKLIAEYADGEDDREENHVVQIYCGVTFCAGMCQLIMYLLATRKSSKHLNDNYKGMAHKFIVAKLLIYPVVSVVLFCVCFAHFTINADVINGVLAGVPLLLYILLKIIIEIVHHNTIHPEDDTEEFPNSEKAEENGNTNNHGISISEKPYDDDTHL